MARRSIARLISELGIPENRPRVLDEIARRCGAQALYIFAPDPDTAHPRPILGAAQTLPRTKGWSEVAYALRKPGEWSMCPEQPDGTHAEVRIWAGQGGQAVVLVRPDPSYRLTALVRDLQLPFDLFRMEFIAANADANCATARELSIRNGQVLKALEEARAELAVKSYRLKEALEAAETAAAYLEDRNVSLRKERENAERIANVDGLTELASRRAFERELQRVVDDYANCGIGAWLIAIDLDGFKEINDTRGHAAGDKVLAAVGRSIARCCGGNNLAGRLGGDEFAVVARVASEEEALALAGVIQDEIRKPFRLQEEIVSVRCTMGLASLPDDAVTAAELMRKADAGLYGAKRSRKGAVGRYTEGIEFVFDERRQAISFLMHALEYNWVMPYYQPKVRLSDTSITGFEALARVRDANGAIHGPARFWRALSEQECVRHLGQRMMELVASDLSVNSAIAAPRRSVSVNVAGPEISSSESVRLLLRILEDAAIEKGLVEVEITETAFVSDELHQVGENIKLLRSEGLAVALDDFGTGFSSLSHLLNWDLDCVKIDQSFVQGVTSSGRCSKIVRSVVELGRSLDIRIVAEGVETDAQAAFLLAIGCPQAQGYLFGAPAPAAATLLSKRPGLHARTQKGG